MHRDGIFISCTLTAVRCENVQERPKPPHEHISPATGKECDSGLCRSLMMEGKKSADGARSSPRPCENVTLAQSPAYWEKVCMARNSVNSGVDTAPGAANTQPNDHSDAVFSPQTQTWDALERGKLHSYSLGLHILYIHCTCPAPQFGLDSTSLPEHKSWCVTDVGFSSHDSS